MFKKMFSLVSIVIVATMLLSACAKPAATEAPVAATEAAATSVATEAPAVTEAASTEPVTLTWWQLSGNDAQIAAWNEMIADYQSKNPNITVTLETRAIDAHKDGLRVAAGTDAFPDIYFMWSGPGLGGEFVAAGSSAPLDEYYTQYGWDSILSPSAVASSTQYGDNHNHGVMSELHGEVIYYRKDSFEKAGITSIPTTYDELIAANDKLVAVGIAPFEFGGTVNWHVMRLLDELLETKCGAEVHDQLNTLQANWGTTPCVAEAFTELKIWSEKYIVKDFMGLSNDQSTALLYSGDAAMVIEGDWMNGALVSAGEDLNDYGVFIFPTGTGRLYGFSQGNYVGATSKHPAEAANFLDYITSAEVQQKYLGTFGAISVNQQVALADDAAQLDKEWVTIFGAATGLFQNNDQNFALDITTEYWRIQNLVCTGELDPAQAGVDLQTFIDNR